MFSRPRIFWSLCAFLLTLAAPHAGSPDARAQSISNSSSAAAPATVNINVTVDALSNRHAISSYVYGGAYPQDATTITDSGLSVVRWGGNATSRYNWKLFTYNAAND